MARLFNFLACCVVVLGSVSSAVAGPLGNAAKAGDVAELERLLNEGADVNESGLASPLFYAIQYNNSDAARLLIERGADVNKASTWGTPIHEGAKRGNTEIVALLLERGADPSVTVHWETFMPRNSLSRRGMTWAIWKVRSTAANLNRYERGWRRTFTSEVNAIRPLNWS